MFEQEGSHDTELQAVRVPRKALPESANNVGASALLGDRSRNPHESKGSLSSPLLYQNEESTGCLNVNAQELNSRSLLRTKTGGQRIFSWFHPTLQNPAGRTMLLFCFTLTFFVFFINIVVTLWAVSKSSVGHGLVAVYRGQCDTARNADIWIHLLINVFATSLLAASNHVMQQICAPSRQDANRRHRIHRSFTIGSLDITNLSGKRLWNCILLSASSLPIHLLYNSIIIPTDVNAQWSSYQVLTTEAQITAIMRNTSIAQTSTREVNGFPDHNFDFPYLDPIANLVKWMQNEPPKLQRLNLTECIDAYATNENRKYGDALIIATGNKIEYDASNLAYDPQAFVPYFLNNVDDGRAFLLSSPERFLFNNTGRGKVEEANNNFGSGAIGSFDWMCNPPRVFQAQTLCDAQAVAPSGKWQYGKKNEVGYCLSRVIPPSSELNLSLPIALAVLLCNLGKLVAMSLAYYIRREDILLTLGDAIASFLREPEGHQSSDLPATEAESQYRRGLEATPAREEKCNDWFWPRYARKRVSLCLLINSAFLVLALVYLRNTIDAAKTLSMGAYSYYNLPWQSSAFWGTGIGSEPLIDSTTYDPSVGGLFGLAGSLLNVNFLKGALVSNTPQLLLSVVYLVNNAVITNFFQVREWNSYGKRQQGLRMTTPQRDSAQRSTYFLTFPLKWSVPFLIFMALTHWFVSQTLFLKRTYATHPGGQTPVTQIGTSPIGLICSSVALLSLFLLVLALVCWPRQWYSPHTCGNSLVISHACHSLSADRDAPLRPVQFGVQSLSEDGTKYCCSFSTATVSSVKLREKDFSDWLRRFERLAYIEELPPPYEQQPALQHGQISIDPQKP